MRFERIASSRSVVVALVFVILVIIWTANHSKSRLVNPADGSLETLDTSKEYQKSTRGKLVDSSPDRCENPKHKSICYRNGSISYRETDGHVAKALSSFGHFDGQQIEVFALFIREGDKVIDAGANIGVFTLYFAERVGPTGKVWAFEVSPPTVSVLATNIFENDFSNQVVIVNTALGSAGEIGRCVRFGGTTDNPEMLSVAEAISSCPAGMPSCSFDGGSFVQGNAYVCPIWTIDTFKIGPNFIKIDVEGMDDRVLLGASGTIERFRPVVYAEHHVAKGNKENRASVPDIMCKWHAYVVFVHTFETDLGLEKWSESAAKRKGAKRKVHMESNALAVPKERFNSETAEQLAKVSGWVKQFKC